MERSSFSRRTGHKAFTFNRVTNNTLLPVFNKPMIFYPIQTLWTLELRNIMIVTGGNMQRFLAYLEMEKIWD